MHGSFAIALIIVLGIAAQWLAWRLKLPSILLLLTAGIIAGPIVGWLHPDELFGDILMPIVALAVGLILYEGGLTLHFKELPHVGRTTLQLVSIGALVTWGLASLAAWAILGMTVQLAVLLGAVLVVTGPTVIQPLLRHIRPRGKVGGILKWEGIVIDPIGAILALLVFEVVLASLHGPGGSHGASEAAASELRSMGMHTVKALLWTLVAGVGAGLVFGVALVEMLRRYWIPDYLGSAASLAFALAAFAIANEIQEESGLVAVTLMGLVVANQRRAHVEEIVEFKENLRVLLISALFIVLAARLSREALLSFGWREIVFVGALILVVRPAATWVSTLGGSLSTAERFFLAWMAPRGIVAAAVSSIFALRLAEAGVPGAENLATSTFAVIIGTVLVYGLTAPLVARRLGLSEANPQGLLIVGADAFTRALARLMVKRGFAVLLVDTNREHTRAARMDGLRIFNGSALSEGFLDEVNLSGIGKVIAATPNDAVNVLVAHRLEKTFGSANVYQVHPDLRTQQDRESHEHLGGRFLFDESATHDHLVDWISAGGEVKATPLTEEFTFDQYVEVHGEHALPLFVITGAGTIEAMTVGRESKPEAGDVLVALVDADDDEPQAKASNAST